MTGTSWRRHQIPEIGVSFDVNTEWPLDERPLDGGGIVTQWLPGDAAFFVRYGSAETMDRFVDGLGDLLTTGTVLSDETAELAGISARTVTAILHRSGKQIPGRPTYVPIQVYVSGLALRDTPVLIGYRVPETTPEDIRNSLEKIVESIEIRVDA